MSNWKLQPVEPTKNMKDACDHTPGPMTAWMAWKVMTTAAPDPTDDAELVERVAKAIAEAAGFETDFDDFADAFELEMEQARGALKAIQEGR